MSGRRYYCPQCGEDITDEVRSAIIAERRYEMMTIGAKGGRSTSEKRKAYEQDHMSKVNAAYTPEKRKAAALKRAETMRRKREERERNQ